MTNGHWFVLWLCMGVAFAVMCNVAVGWRARARDLERTCADQRDFIEWLGEYFNRHIEARRMLNDQLRAKLDEHYAKLAKHPGRNKDVN